MSRQNVRPLTRAEARAALAALRSVKLKWGALDDVEQAAVAKLELVAEARIDTIEAA